MNSILRRRRGIMGQKAGDVLTPVTKITSNGTRIYTGLSCDSETVLMVRVVTPSSSGQRTMFNMGPSATESYVAQKNTNYIVGKLCGASVSDTYMKAGTHTITIDFTTGELKIDGTVKYTASAVYDTTQVQVGNAAGIGIVYVKWKKNDVVIHDLEPYLLNGKPGLYDVITGEFYTVEEGGTDWSYA